MIVVCVALGTMLFVATEARAERMSILYDVDSSVAAIVAPTDPSIPGLGMDRGAYRQEGSSGHLFAGDADASHRLGKVSGRSLSGKSSAQIVSLLKAQIDGGCVMADRDYGCESHMVSVDEIGNHFNDRRGAALAKSFSQAMALLEQDVSPYGGSYASRVHVYLAPAMTAMFAKAGGVDYNLGRDGKPHFATWKGVMPGLARAGGVWLEMYHATGGVVRPFSVGEWTRGPGNVVKMLTRYGGSYERVHFLIAGYDVLPPGRVPAGCSTPMGCTWALAALPGANSSILNNGPGAYRVGEHASEWLSEYNRRILAQP